MGGSTLYLHINKVNSCGTKGVHPHLQPHFLNIYNLGISHTYTHTHEKRT